MSLQVGVWGDPQVIGASIAELCALYGLTVWTSPRRFLLGTVAVTVAVLAAAAAQTLSSTAVALSEHLAWYADLAAHVHGAHTLTIKRVELLISDSPSDPTAAPSLVQQGLSASHKPFRLTLGRNGKWDGTLGSGGQPLPGTYGSLEIGYNVDRHDVEEEVKTMSTATETRTGTCATHGTIQAQRQLPKVTFPFLITAPMRYFAKRKPFRCPECGSPVA